jgi:DNA-binding transcriptional regulator YiaG
LRLFHGIANLIPMNELRQLRRGRTLTQAQLAERLRVPLNTFRMWDSGMRIVPPAVLRSVRVALVEYDRQNELLSLRTVAAEVGVHRSTLEIAIRTGRLAAHFLARSAFGRPIRRVTRADAERFRQSGYGRRAGLTASASPLPNVPDDYDMQLQAMRRRLSLTQAALAAEIGAAGKAVVYQWESRKRVPSPVFWRRLQELHPTDITSPD